MNRIFIIRFTISHLFLKESVLSSDRSWLCAPCLYRSHFHFVLICLLKLHTSGFTVSLAHPPPRAFSRSPLGVLLRAGHCGRRWEYSTEPEKVLILIELTTFCAGRQAMKKECPGVGW